jgi:GDP/UDP-N,N'-diacetylbacillosamine 2-epimerase (hydrolysing)
MRKIFIVIERRADYSRYKPILQRLKKDRFFKTHLVVTGNCLLEKHGRDIDKIRDDGFEINAEIPMFIENSEDSGAEMVRSLSRVMAGLVDELEAARPDIVLSGFDIGGNLAVTIAAAHMNVPVAHIQGGEVTGSIDESIRHAMSKFAHIHFPATELSKKRLIRMGESPDLIFVVGCPSIDVLVNTPYMPKSQVEKELDIDLSFPTLLMIQHPVTTESVHSVDQIIQTIEAIKQCNIQCVCLLPNNDAGHGNIIKHIKSSGIKWFPSLPTNLFINFYRNVSALIGNSSSGIHETPTLKIPAINIGSRQQGRERAGNVIDAEHDVKKIVEAINKAVFDESFRNYVKTIENPYGDGNSAEKIVQILKTISLEGIIQKKFYD